MAQRSPAPFLRKTWEIVSDPNNESVISWSSQGTSFIVWKPADFAKDILPAHFKHCNFSSFVRQLNTYGFRKVDPDRWEFANDSFQRHNKDLMMGIVRRKPHTTTGPMAVGSGSGLGSGTAPTSALGNSHVNTHPNTHASAASGASPPSSNVNAPVLGAQPAPAPQEFKPNPSLLDAAYVSGQMPMPGSQPGSMPSGQLPILPLMPGPMPMANLGPVASQIPGGLSMPYQLSSSAPSAMFESVMEMMAAQQKQNRAQPGGPANVVLQEKHNTGEPWCDNTRAAADMSEQCSDSNRNWEEDCPGGGAGPPPMTAPARFPDRAAALLDAVALAQQELPQTDPDPDQDAMEAEDGHGVTPPARQRSNSLDVPRRPGPREVAVADVVSSQNKLNSMMGSYLRPGQQVMASITGEQQTPAVLIPVPAHRSRNGGGSYNSSDHHDPYPHDGPRSLARTARDGHDGLLAAGAAYTTSGTSSGNRTDTVGSDPGVASGSGDGGNAGNMDVEEMSKAGKRSRALLYSNHSEAADGVGMPTVIPVPATAAGRPYTGSNETHAGAPIKPKPQSMPHITHGILAEMADQLGRLATLAHQVEELKTENMELRRGMERLRQDHYIGRRQGSLVANNTQTDPTWPHHNPAANVPGSSNASGDPGSAQQQQQQQPKHEPSHHGPQSEADAQLPGSGSQQVTTDGAMPMDGVIIQASHEAGRTYVTGSYEGRPPSSSGAVARRSPVSAPGLIELSVPPGPTSLGIAREHLRNACGGSTESGTVAGTPTTSSSMQAGGGGGTVSMEVGNAGTASGGAGSGPGPSNNLSTAELQNLLLDQQQKYSVLKLRSDDVEAQMAAARQQSMEQQQRTEALQAQVAVAAKASLDTVELAKTLQEALAAQYTTAAVADARSKDLEARLRAQETENQAQKQLSAVLQAKIAALESQLRGLSQMVGSVETTTHSHSHSRGSRGPPPGNAADVVSAAAVDGSSAQHATGPVQRAGQQQQQCCILPDQAPLPGMGEPIGRQAIEECVPVQVKSEPIEM